MNKYENRVLASYDDCEVLERITQDEWVSLVLRKR